MEKDRSLFLHFGLDPDVVVWTATHERYAQRVAEAVESRRVVAVIGPYGSGKTTMVQHALDTLPKVEQVYVTNPDRERLRIGHVIATMIYSLSSESPRPNAVAKEIQLARIVGETVVTRHREVCVVIENAHRLSSELLLALKDLRESVRYKGRGFLFSILLVGQEGLRSKLERFGEVEERTRAIELDKNGWMSLQDRQGYLDTVYGDLIAGDVADRLAVLFRTPLALDHVVQQKMLQMRDAGVRRLDSTIYPLSLTEQIKALRLSVRDIERATKVPKSTVQDVLSGQNTDPDKIRQIQDGINDLVASRAA